MSVPSIRLRVVGDRPLRPDGAFVLYWMTAFRRPVHNFALDHAVDRARELDRPLVVLEPLRVGYRWASDRLHRFVLDGMRDHVAHFAERPVVYHPYVEPEPGAGRGLLAKLGSRACLVVGDDYPSFFLPRMVRRAAEVLPCRLEVVDGNGLLPLRAVDRTFPVAHAFRRALQRELPSLLDERPRADPFDGGPLPELPKPTLPRAVSERWPPASPALLDGDPAALARLPIDHGVPPVELEGGFRAGAARLAAFLRRLDAYAEDRSHPDDDAGSGLSPYLHFGHVGAHQIFEALCARESWSPARLAPKPTGRREGWWGMSPAAEAFLDELVTWRELGFNRTQHDPEGADRFASLPDWARATLAAHASDPRPHVYDLATFEAARTHDPVWNAAQRQLLEEGRIHNYMRMLWGKKILEWARSPEEALEVMLTLNDRYALDGRDPNSLSGIFWVLGRYDRAWGPERPIFGKVRFMSSASTRRKLRAEAYLARWGGDDALDPADPAAQD